MAYGNLLNVELLQPQVGDLLEGEFFLELYGNIARAKPQPEVRAIDAYLK
jgi:hypothetical protein